VLLTALSVLLQGGFVGLGFSGLATFYADMVSALDAAARWVLCYVGNPACCYNPSVFGDREVVFCAVLPDLRAIVR
jgi:hypothetical protein